jgi:hypothetical protein
VKNSIKTAKTLVMAFTLALAGLSTGIIGIAPVAAACTQGSIVLYENANAGGSSVTLCVGSAGAVTDLRNIPFSPSGSCNAPIKVGDDWNNCVSSYVVHFVTGRCARFYDTTPPAGYLDAADTSDNSQIHNLSGDKNDKLSFIRYGNMNPPTGNTCPWG